MPGANQQRGPQSLGGVSQQGSRTRLCGCRWSAPPWHGLGRFCRTSSSPKFRSL